MPVPTYIDYTEGDNPPREFTIGPCDFEPVTVVARLVEHPKGYWDRIATRRDGTTYTNTMSDQSCLAMLLDALQRKLPVTVS